eukprot:TRINITY_DN2065_c0_g1_i2.p1 TRINITY_DN2065_c0_g1~~TRINITY_DN2065_c0_g1_i2.p1  ORF type:complete len:141 (+),score=11.37 TRINITY_DN2065_c0_g1_i2:108-530(+)
MEDHNGSTEIEMDSASNSTETTSILSKPEEQTKNPYWVGNTMALCYRNGTALFTIGPQCTLWLFLGPFFIVLNGILISLSVLGLCFVVVRASPLTAYIGFIFFLFQIVSYFLTFIMNPGIPRSKLALHDQLSIDRIKDNP